MGFLHLRGPAFRRFDRAGNVHDYAQHLRRVFGFIQVFYGIGAISVVAVVLVVVAVFGLDPLGTVGEGVPRSAAAVEMSAPPPYKDNITYLVSSQRAADDLMAYGAGLPTNDPTRLLPLANVKVVVAVSAADEALARSAADPSTRIIDLR